MYLGMQCDWMLIVHTHTHSVLALLPKCVGNDDHWLKGEGHMGVNKCKFEVIFGIFFLKIKFLQFLARPHGFKWPKQPRQQKECDKLFLIA
jgi:hypothetical protein